MKSSSIPDWQVFKSLFEEHEKVENEVQEEKDTYKGLAPEALYTSLEDLFALFQSQYVSGQWVDLGCGLGQSVLLYGSLFTERKAIGVERSLPRIQRALEYQSKLGLKNVDLISGDLAHMEIPEGDTYFLYFPTGPVLDRVLFELSKKEHFHLVAIESHGDLLERLKREPNLECVESIPLSSERHYPEALVFRQNKNSIPRGPHDLSFQDKILYIQDSVRLWLGESLNMEWASEDKFELKIPPRTIQWRQVQEIKSWEDLPTELRDLLCWRRWGELEIETEGAKRRGYLRKIALSPVFEVEISSGEWVKWSDVLSLTWKGKICYASS